MSTLPERSNLDHLRKQAKELLRQYRRQESTAFDRLRSALPAARGKNDGALAALQLRLHDMQSCVAREYGFASWNELKDAVDLQHAKAQDRRELQLYWLRLVYGGDVAGGVGQPRPRLAARLLAEQPDLIEDDAHLACALGDESAIRRAVANDPDWVNRSAGLLNMPPLIAVTHSTLATLDAWREPLRRCVRLLLEKGASPNQSIADRRPPNSLEKPGEGRLTAIYGAAGKLHDERMTAVLLAAGADGNDNESLYHSIEDPNPELPCTRLLLEAGTRVAGSNALAHVLDYDNLDGLQMLLAHTARGDPDLGRILHWAIYRARSAAHVRALLDAGADPRALDQHQQSVYRHAASYGLPEIMRLLEEGGAGEPLTDAERFVAACVRADETEARRLIGQQPGLLASLTAAQLRQLPNMAQAGREDAVRLMVELGWPITARGGDIDGSALNWAVFRGNASLTEFLLERGASFREPHCHGSDVIGTLSWASINQPRGEGNWPKCASLLLAHGMPQAAPLPDDEQARPLRTLSIDGRRFHFPDEIAEILLATEN